MKTKRFVHIDLIGYVKHKKPFFLRIFLTKLSAKFFELFYHFILINFKYFSRGCGNSQQNVILDYVHFNVSFAFYRAADHTKISF